MPHEKITELLNEMQKLQGNLLSIGTKIDALHREIKVQQYYENTVKRIEAALKGEDK